MTHGSLFSGIGGFDLAAQWMGWQNVFHCEWNTFGQKVLKYYWPEAISYNDITKTDFTIHRGRIDILTGGFPCQPYSTAGKRLGNEDDRHLWPEMCRAIREIQPRWVVGENVLGLVGWNGGMVFNEVQADLEAEGYEVQPVVLAAAGVSAPHRRDRIWFIAYSNKNGHSANGRKISEEDKIQGIDREEMGSWEFNRTSISWNASNTGNKGLQGDKFDGSFDAKKWEQKLSHITATESHKITHWERFPSVSPICDGDDGISNRLDGITFPKWRQESVKAGGNAVVPQLVMQIFKTIAEYEELIIQRPSV